MFLSGWKEWTIAGATALGIYSLYWMGGAWNKGGHTSQHIEESYEMVRAKDSFWGRFDLSRREVEYTRTGERPSENKVAANLAAAKGVVGKAPATQVLPKKNDPKAKDPKLAKAEAAKKKAALAKQQALAKKNGVSLRVVGDNSKSTLSQDPQQNTKPPTQSGIVAPPAAAAQVTPANPADDPADAKLSPGQWYSLLQSQPTSANAKKFFEAKSQLGEKNYYDILSKLLRDSQAERQKIALLILNADVSIGTFKFLVTAPADLQKTDTVAKGFATLIQAYGQDRSRFLVLSQALTSAEPQVVLTSQALIQTSVASISTATNTSQQQTGTRVSTLSRNDFNIFKPALARLIKNQNQQIADNAKNLYIALWQQVPDQAIAGN